MVKPVRFKIYWDRNALDQLKEILEEVREKMKKKKKKNNITRESESDLIVSN